MPPLHYGVVTIEKGVFRSPLTKVASFTYKQDLALDNQQWFICYKTQPNKKNIPVKQTVLQYSKCPHQSEHSLDVFHLEHSWQYSNSGTI